jgi:hypothetical protein
MEEPDLRQLDGEVAEEDEFCAVPLLFGGRYLVLICISIDRNGDV